jgi:hypothetical protein
VSTTELCEFEVQILRELAGELPASPWGAAVGATLGFLKGSGFAEVNNGTYSISDKGRAELDKRVHQ